MANRPKIEQLKSVFAKQKRDLENKYLNQIEDLSQENQELREEIKELEDLVQGLKSVLDDQGSSSGGKDESRNENQILKKKINELQLQLKSKEDEIVRLYETQNSMKFDTTKSTSRDEELKKKDLKIQQLVKVIEKVLSETKKKMSVTLKENQSQRLKLVEIQKKSEEDSKKNNILVNQQKNKIKEMERNITKLQNELKLKNSKIVKNENQIKIMEKEAIELGRKLEKSIRNGGGSGNGGGMDENEFEKKMEEVEEILITREEEIDNLKKQLNDMAIKMHTESSQVLVLENVENVIRKRIERLQLTNESLDEIEKKL